MHVEKVAYAIRKLRRVNATLRPEQFDIGSWVTRTECGTTACAIGWLLYDDVEAVKYLGVMPAFIGDNGQAALLLAPGGAPVTPACLLEQFGLVAAMFGITKEEAMDLFSGTHYSDLDREPTLTDVLDRFTMFFYLNGGTEEMLYDSDLHAMQIVERSLSEFTVDVEDEVF